MTVAVDHRASPREWAGLALLALPTALLGLDVTVLHLVLPSVATDLAPSATQALWIVDAYGFFIAGFLITMGTLGDRIGRRRLLVIGVTAFALLSVAAAFAPTAGALIVARALLGIAGATLMPSTLSLISNMFVDTRQKAIAIGVWATMFAIGMALGPLVGGVLVGSFWWGAAFLVAVPVAAVVLIGAPILLPEFADPQAGRFDLTSVALSLAAILSSVYAVKQVAADGPTVSAVSFLILGVAAGTLFVRRQRHLPAPLLDVRLFADRTFAAALGVLLIGLVGVGGTMYMVTQYLQLVEGLTPVAAGLWMGPPALAMLASAIGGPLLARKIPAGQVMAAALGLSLIGYGLLATTGLGVPLRVAIAYGFVYLGLGAITALGTAMVVGTAPAAKSGSAGAMSETVQELGVAVGVALFGSIATATYQARSVVPDGVSPAVARLANDSLSGALAVAGDLPGEFVTGARLAFAAGVNVASAVAGAAILAAIVLCIVQLRHIRPLDDPSGSAAEQP